MQVGKVGAYSMYVRRGEQVVRQRKNSSNYGVEASRSISQQSRRVLWSNLVNFYRTNMSWMQKAFESLKAGQTIYNRFMQLNIDKSQVALTKQEAFAGACLCDAFTVSDGKLPAIRYAATTEGITPVYINTGDIISTTGVTLGQLSAAIIEHNTYFQDGDNIAWVFLVQEYNVGDVPRVVPNYMEITLNTESTTPLEDIPAFGFEWVTISGRKLAANSSVDTGDYAGFVCIHTRRSNGLQVSPQKICMVDTSLRDQFSTTQQKNAAIDSYGLDSEVPLQPNFKLARILSALVNSVDATAALPLFPSYTGAQTLVLSVEGWNDETCYLMFGDVRYTPLGVDGNSRSYIIGDNGSVRIYINNQLYGGFEVTGVEPPDGFPTLLKMCLTPNSGFPATSKGYIQSVEGNCINYPRKATDIQKHFIFSMSEYEGTLSESDFICFNCEIIAFGSDGDTPNSLILSVTDSNSPGYIILQGFIVAVFNYN